MITIDDLARVCGYFSSTSQVNNYYNCSHSRQQEKETDESTGKTVGACHRFSCPVAHNVRGDWMGVDDKEIIKKLRKTPFLQPKS